MVNHFLYLNIVRVLPSEYVFEHEVYWLQTAVTFRTYKYQVNSYTCNVLNRLDWLPHGNCF
jgi:hypothetical protein